MADYWQQINSLFLRAIDIAPAERSAFLAETCAGDGDLQHQVESLLVSHDRASQFLERPGFTVIHNPDGAAPSGGSTGSLRPDGRRLVTRWVRGALELPLPARPLWLKAAARSFPELVSDAQTLLSVATDFTTSALEAVAESTVGVTEAAGAETGSRRLIVGQRLAHYDLVSWLGAGGMGEVFRARDTALGRDAALKVIPRRFTPALRLRLLREAEASARLQHPAIATFYEAGEDAGEAFIAMEFVDGVTLRRRLSEGPVPLAEVLAMTRCLLEALQHAHTAGILHRDIKPENIVVTGPHSAKLLDFGLARHLLAAAEEQHVAPLAGDINLTSSLITGTLGYMAPEQLRRDALDARTDVFQVGAVLYELLTGSPAFPGSSPLERIAAVMLRQPDFDMPALAALPAGVRRILERALRREPAERYPTAAAFLADLEDVGGRPHLSRSETVAVLDLETLSPDEPTAWVATTVTESLRTALAHAPGVTLIARERVVAASKALGMLDPRAGPVRVGLHLGCGRVVSGAYRSIGPNLKVSLQLHDVSTGRLTASPEAEGSMDDIIVLETALRDRVLGHLARTIHE